MILNWRDDARVDLVRIIDYIARENPVAARKVARELLLAADSLMLFPRRGRPGRIDGTRELLAIHPYILIYEILSEDRLDILNVWHSAQDKP